MSRLLPTVPVKVRIGDCLCPGAPHTEGDFAYLRPRLTAQGGITATTIMNTSTDARAAMVDLGMAFLTDGLLRWDLLDDDGEPIPCDEATLRGGALSWEETLLPIAEEAHRLYMDSVLHPFRTARESISSRSGPTADSTSASPDS